MSKEYYNSRRYHSFFEGYTEKTVVENGKRKIIRVYTGDFYRPKLTAQDRKRRKLLDGALYVLTLCLYFYCATRQLEINLSPLVAICQGFEILVLLWLSLSIVDYLRTGERMTVSVYRTACGRMTRLSLAAAVLFGLMSLLYLVLTLWRGSWREFFRLFPFSLLCGIAMFAVYHMEKNTEYERILSTEPPIRDGKEIKY